MVELTTQSLPLFKRLSYLFRKVKQRLVYRYRRQNRYTQFMKHEFDIIRRENPDAIILGYEKEIKAILLKHGREGHSGGSVGAYVSIISSVIKKLCLFEPIAPITDNPEDWFTTDPDEKIFQHRRLSSLFKEGDTVIYLDAIEFHVVGEEFNFGGSVTLENGTRLRSSQKIKGFPFTLKKFQLDLYEIPETDNDGNVIKGSNVYKIANPAQLKDIAEYYDLKDINGNDIQL